jgi:radical SAM superfamily enzyme YgiQ (UPF0313 family)
MLCMLSIEMGDIMKLLLVAVNAKYIHSNLAVYSLKAYAEKYLSDSQQQAVQLTLAEYTINHSEEDILAGIYEEKADVVAFSCYIWNIDIILRISAELKKVSPKLRIWLGGPEVSYDAMQCLEKHSEPDGIMLGEGERTFLELVLHYACSDRALGEIAGLAYRDEESNQIRMTEARQPLNLDQIPFPYESGTDFENRIIYYESSRGCPFSCSYCLSSIDRRVRLRSTELVKRELQILLDRNVPQVKFVDRTFNCNRQHAMELWQFIKEKDNGITNFHFEISADLLEEEEIAFLASLRPGLVQFEIGVQSTNPDTVKAICRRMDLSKLRKNVALIKKNGNIHQHLDLIAGLPLEDYASFEQSFKEVYSMKPDQRQLGFLKVLKGSPMEQSAKEYGIVYRNTAPYEVLTTDKLTFEEVLRLKGVCEMVEVYYNSGQFSYAIAYLEHFYPSPMKLYEELYDYYKSKKMLMIAHSRIRRYEILLDFYKERVLERETSGEGSISGSRDFSTEALWLFEEILLFELFLRENIKNHPGFVRNKPKYDFRDIYDAYRKEHKQIHIEVFSFDPEISALEGRTVRQETVILFDYSRRDPLRHSAAYQRLKLNMGRRLP